MVTKKSTETKVSKKTVKKDALDKYAIFETGGKQYQAIQGKTIAIEKVDGQPGDIVEFKEVLLRKTAPGEVVIGQPFLHEPVKASIIKHTRGEKIIVFKFKRRKKSRVKKGHRQEQTVIRIESV